MPLKTELACWLWMFDLHYPQVDWPTFEAGMDFIAKNKLAGFGFGGDQFDNAEISHHNANKPIYKERRSYQRNTEGFDRDILSPLETNLGKADRVWIIGNHDDWEFQFIEEHPELEGVIERPAGLGLEDRGWKVVSLGCSYKLGKLHIIHGEV